MPPILSVLSIAIIRKVVISKVIISIFVAEEDGKGKPLKRLPQDCEEYEGKNRL